MAGWLETCVMVAVVANMAAAYPTYAGEGDEEDMATLMQAIRAAKMGYYDNYGGYPDLDYLRARLGNQKPDYDVLPEETAGRLELDDEWPTEDLELGQVGGVATSPDNNVHVFHRQDRMWTDDSFNHTTNEYLQKSLGPIANDTVYVVDGNSGKLMTSWGAQRFYMPHGLTICPLGFYWLTDVALHQVFKFKYSQPDVPVLTLGRAFEAAKDNSDTERFCKPTDVAVSSRGDVFVADGYCNSRIMKFTSTGDYVTQFGDDSFWVPHSLALAEDMNLLCVADRENKRIVCYNAGLDDPEQLGVPEREYRDINLGRVFSIAYSQNDGMLYGVNGSSNAGDVATGFSIDLRRENTRHGNVLNTWAPEKTGFSQPHALAVTQDGSSVYVGEIGPNNVWKFVALEDEEEEE